MTDVFGVLAQSLPAAGALTDVYTCPPANAGVSISSVVFCNQSKTQPAQVRVSVAVSGSADDASQYLFFDVVLQPRETLAVVIGITIGTSDVVRCQSDTGAVSFNLFGVQIQ